MNPKPDAPLVLALDDNSATLPLVGGKGASLAHICARRFSGATRFPHHHQRIHRTDCSLSTDS